VTGTLWEALQVDPEAAIAALTPGERFRLWRAGVLMEGPISSSTPVRPTDRLRVAPHLELQERVSFSEAGQATVTLRVGAAEVDFDEPDLLLFGRTLAARRAGFDAGEATGWAREGQALTWERVAGMLETLVAMGVLERAK
jgi:hypothetical protein